MTPLTVGSVATLVKVVFELRALVGVEELAEVPSDHFFLAVAEVFRGRLIDREEHSREVVTADERATVLHELAIAALAVEKCQKDFRPKLVLLECGAGIGEDALELANARVDLALALTREGRCLAHGVVPRPRG